MKTLIDKCTWHTIQVLLAWLLACIGLLNLCFNKPESDRIFCYKMHLESKGLDY